jgi:hypothetical protein
MASRRQSRRQRHAGEPAPNAEEGLDSVDGLPAEAPADVSRDELRGRLEGGDHADVRMDKLARAQQLAADPNYPPPEVLESVARLLAKHLRPGHDD